MTHCRPPAGDGTAPRVRLAGCDTPPWRGYLLRLSVLHPVRGLRAVPARGSPSGSRCTTGACSARTPGSGLDNYTRAVRRRVLLERAPQHLRHLRAGDGAAAIAGALVLAHLLNQRLRARRFWRMGVLLPNVTSVAAVGIIFTLLFARDFGLVNWLLGHRRRRPDRLAGEPLVVVAGDLGDGRLALDRLQRADLPRRAAGGAAGAVRGGRARRRQRAAGSSGRSRSRCCGRR